MLALFLRIQLLQLPSLKRAVEAEQWPAGGAVLGQIRRLVGINLILGLLVVALASARPCSDSPQKPGARPGWISTQLIDQGRASTSASTRRLIARPSSVELSATGRDSP